MGGVATATVETLVAEVRVLMVGSRQVTLSVARQLDWVALSGLEIFGRVKLGAGYDEKVVIGRSSTGKLALATFERHPEYFVPFIESEQIVQVCKSMYEQRDRLTVKHRDRRIEISHVPEDKWCKVSHSSWGLNEPPCTPWIQLTMDAGVCMDVAIARADISRELHEAAGASELIVLAGLR